MGLLFSPRGGSALVAGYLSRALIARGRHVTLACGSLGDVGALGNAETFFAGIDTVPAAYDGAVERWELGGERLGAADRGAADRADPVPAVVSHLVITENDDDASRRAARLPPSHRQTEHPGHLDWRVRPRHVWSSCGGARLDTRSVAHGRRVSSKLTLRAPIPAQMEFG